jgi:hypothetical protein
MTRLPAAFGVDGNYPRPSKCFIKFNYDRYKTLEVLILKIARSIISQARYTSLHLNAKNRAYLTEIKVTALASYLLKLRSNVLK